MKAAVTLFLLLSTGCATARLVGEPSVVPADRGEPRVVVVEPFFETAQWQLGVKTEIATVVGTSPVGNTFGSPFAQDVAVQRTVADKPLFARIPALAAAHRQVIGEVRRLRPSWRVASPGAVTALTGPASLVRVIVNDAELVESNRALKNLAFGFGLVILPLQLFNLSPVEETQRVYGSLLRYQLDVEALEGRFVRYPTQPDFAVNTNNLPAVEQRFGLDVAYEEGLLANEEPREGVLITGFAQRLAAAIVALVEER